MTDVEWVKEPARGIARWLPCPMHIYDNAHRADDARWLSSHPPAVTLAAQTAKAYLGVTAGGTINVAKFLVTRRLLRKNLLAGWRSGRDSAATACA